MAVINGTPFNDGLVGTAASDVIDGFGGDDVIDARQGGDDTLRGGGDDDTILLGAALTAADAVDGGDGVDAVELAGDYSAGVAFSATTMTNVEFLRFGAGVYRLTLHEATVAAGQTLNVEGQLLGAGHHLHLDASADSDGNYYVLSGAGDDVFVAGGGEMWISSGDGNDTLIVAAGAHFLRGGEGTDTIVLDYSASTGAVRATHPSFAGDTGGFTDDIGRSVYYESVERLDITTGDQNDTIVAGFGDDRVMLNGGDDFLNAQAGADIADGGAGIDGVSVYWVDTTEAVHWNLQTNSYSGPGSFTNFEYFGVAQFGSGDDVIVTGKAAYDDNLYSSGGHDHFTVFNGHDHIGGSGAGFITLVVDYSDALQSVRIDSLSRIAEGTRRSVNAGADVLEVRTGDGDDFLSSGTTGTMRGDASDRFYLGGGDDFVDVGRGDDVADGGDGIDGIAASFASRSGAFLWDLQSNRYSGPVGDFTNFEYFDRLWTGSGNDVIVTTGVDRDEQIFAGAGNDTITVVNGQDEVNGGDGTDTLVIDWSASTTRIGSAGSSAVGDQQGRRVDHWSIERFILTAGSGDDALGGLIGDDVIDGGSGADHVGGGNGDDLLMGGDGDDWVTGGFHDDQVQGGAGADTLYGDEGADVVAGGAGRDTLSGGAGDDKLYGGGDRDRLDGGAGADRMQGGLGDDVYVVDSASDVVTETSGGGVDTVESSIMIYTLGAHLENLILLAGGSGTGNGLANTITGNASGNVLDGKGGADLLIGGGGDDRYFVDHRFDRIVEGSGGGVDLVRSSVSFALGAHIENLILTGAVATFGVGNALANSITGNDVSNTLKGWSGNDALSGGLGDDWLDGGKGADALYGGGGNDTFVVDDAGDVVSEASATGGIDTVRSGIDYVLGAHLENLKLTGKAALDGQGNALGNTLIGNVAANILRGGGGDDRLEGRDGGDTLAGGKGNDVLAGQYGADRFLFDAALDSATNVDTILDFKSGKDSIVLENAIFQGLAAGALSANALAVGAAAADADDRIVYDPATGNLFYDPDGSGAAAQVQFATLANAPAILAASDFAVI